VFLCSEVSAEVISQVNQDLVDKIDYLCFELSTDLISKMNHDVVDKINNRIDIAGGEVAWLCMPGQNNVRPWRAYL